MYQNITINSSLVVTLKIDVNANVTPWIVETQEELVKQ